MNSSIEDGMISLIPEDDFDYFILGRISAYVKRYDYDFNRDGDRRTIATFRIKMDEILDVLARV